MTDRDTLRNLLIAGGVFLIILYIAPRLIPLPPPRAATTTDASTAAPHRATASSDTTGATGTPVAGLAEATDVPSTSPAVEPTHSPQRFEVREAPEEQTRVMGSAPAGEKDAARASPYRMRLMFSNVGAAVETATMTDHAATVGSTERYVLLHPVQRDDGTMVRSLAVESVTIDDVPVALHDRRWHVGDVTETEKGQRLS
ncbi:MAG: hypothetical protein ACE5EX_03135, partial [Phycisphaerae bacterium]